MANEIIIEDLKSIISIANVKGQEKFKQFNITKAGGIRVTLAEVLCDPGTPEASDLLMWVPYDDIIKTLARARDRVRINII